MKLDAGSLSRVDFTVIKTALLIPETLPNRDLAVTYRNRLTHHVRPSVDYTMFFSTLTSRVGQEVTDSQGNIIGRQHVLYARPPLDYRFEELNIAYTQYLDAIVEMLEQLSQIQVLRR